MVLAAGCASSRPADSLREPIEARAVGLGYSSETAGALADMVSRWPLSKSCDGERSLAKQIALTIAGRITADQTSFDLADVTAQRRANCLGYTQLFCVLAGSAGLSVTPVSVREFQKADAPANGLRHVCCLVMLSNGTTLLVNPAPPVLISRPFLFEETYAQEGNYFTLRSEDNPLCLYRKIQILDDAGLAAHVHNSRGAAMAARNELPEALEQYDKAVALHPLFAEPWNNRAIALVRSGDPNAALSSYDRAIEIDGDYAEAYYNRAAARVKLGEREKAIEDYSRAIRLNPRMNQAYINRALCYASLSERDAARRDLQLAVKLNPSSATAERVARISDRMGIDRQGAGK
jgi:Flp pilus assembly protein TadD